MKHLILAGLLAAGMTAWAAPESSTTSVSTSEASGATGESTSKIRNLIGDKKFAEDQKLKDLELRAYAGSMSRYSLQFNLGYSGPPSNDWSNPNRPDPNHSSDPRTYMSGSANGRVRLTSKDALSFGTGLKFFQPVQALEGKQDRPKNRDNYEVSDPFLSLDHSYVMGPVQMRSSLSVSATTDQYYKSQGQWGEATIKQYFKYNPHHSRTIWGLYVSADYFGYDRDYRPTKTADFSADSSTVSKYYVNFIPSFEYKIVDHVNFNTSLDYPYSNLRSDKSWWRWQHPQSTWRVGAGWAITRDIYINPYINFYLESPSFNTASANFNTTFSIF